MAALMGRLINLLSRKFLLVGLVAAVPFLKDLVSSPDFRRLFYITAGIIGLYIIADVVQDGLIRWMELKLRLEELRREGEAEG